LRLPAATRGLGFLEVEAAAIAYTVVDATDAASTAQESPLAGASPPHSPRSGPHAEHDKDEEATREEEEQRVHGTPPD
jgi:hypothetical protein